MTAVTTSSALATDRSDELTLLGLVGQLELVAFTRLAADSALAPSLDQRLRLARFSAGAVARLDRIFDRIRELGASPQDEVARFAHVMDDFDVRTPSSIWSERLLKAFVGYGVADDFCKAAAAGLAEETCTLVNEVLDGASHADLVVAELGAAGADDDVLIARLALWGRRMVGESLGVVQSLLQSQPGLARLVTEGAVIRGEAADDAGHPDAVGRLFGWLTAEHTHRMERLGLTA
ncbi:MAG TPA: ferritin-like fold-containing protein [Pengzhenrongella sp.]